MASLTTQCVLDCVIVKGCQVCAVQQYDPVYSIIPPVEGKVRVVKMSSQGEDIDWGLIRYGDRFGNVRGNVTESARCDV